jgi:hypothetical protein
MVRVPARQAGSRGFESRRCRCITGMPWSDEEVRRQQEAKEAEERAKRQAALDKQAAKAARRWGAARKAASRKK